MRLSLASATLAALALTTPASAQEIGTPFCFGDGSGATCPCNFVSSPGHGCPNGYGPSGARLRAGGLASVSADSVEFTLDLGGATPWSIGLLFQGSNQLAGGAGLPFGDGLRCTGGSVRRIGLSVGMQDMSFPAAFDPGQVSVRGGVPAAGGTFHYQAWYRDVSVHCASTFNTSNGLTLTWAP